MESVMRRIFHFSMLCLAAGVVNACKPQEVFETEDIPTAGVRFINAVPDTGAMDFRPVDILENTTFYNVTFRDATLLLYKNTQAGTDRHFRIFRSPTSGAPPAQQLAEASTVVADLPGVTLEAGKNYTFILWGYSRTGSTPAMKVTQLTDDPADPGSQVALRVINASGAAIDVTDYLSTGAPGAVTWANVPALTASSYVTRAPGQYRYNVKAAGGANPLFADVLAPVGAAETVDQDALPGTTVAGSAVSLVVFPGSVPGTTAAQFVITTGGTSLSATATGYARASGSFITNGFVPGLQINASGFTNAANNGLSTITAVTATTLTVTKVGGTVAEAAASPRTLVSSPPPPSSLVVWDRRPPRCATITPPNLCLH
jgi:hypothetical protein